MTVVIDTNVTLGMFGALHPHHGIFMAFAANRFAWAVSTEILLEYEEVIARQASASRAARAFQMIDAVAAWRGNLRHIIPHFRWHLIIADPDDDKFADCAIAAGAEWILTEDAHFDPLKTAGHQPQPITPAEFIARFLAP